MAMDDKYVTGASHYRQGSKYLPTHSTSSTIYIYIICLNNNSTRWYKPVLYSMITSKIEGLIHNAREHKIQDHRILYNIFNYINLIEPNTKAQRFSVGCNLQC